MFKIVISILFIALTALAQTGTGSTYTIETTDSPAGTYTSGTGATHSVRFMSEETVVKQEAFGTEYGLRFGMLAAQLGTVPVNTPSPNADPVATYQGHRGLSGKGTIWGCGTVSDTTSINRSIYNLLVTALPLLFLLVLRLRLSLSPKRVKFKR